MTETVLTLEPLDFNAIGNTLKLQLKGIPCAGKQVIKIDYPASFAKTSIEEGVAALNHAVRTIAGPKTVFAHSQGAQVASRWLRRYGSNLDAPPWNELKFLLIGNPLRFYGGWIVGRPEVDGATGIPTPNYTRYDVTDITMQYDGWSDYPTRPSTAARINATRGKNGRHCYGYLAADPNDPGRKTYREGTTTYVLLPGKPVIPVPQAIIEAGYDRPER